MCSPSHLQNLLHICRIFVFFSCRLCLTDTDLVSLVSSCSISNISMSKKDKQKEVQPLKQLLLSLVYSAAVCALCITYGQTGMDLCFSVNETTFPVRMSRRVCRCTMWKVCWGLKEQGWQIVVFAFNQRQNTHIFGEHVLIN